MLLTLEVQYKTLTPYPNPNPKTATTAAGKQGSVSYYYFECIYLFMVYVKNPFNFPVTDCSQNGLDHPSVDMSLEDNSGILVDGFERTYDGKLKCRYCNYATRGTARLIEHIRIHTGKCITANLQEVTLMRFWCLACFLLNRRETSPLPPLPICFGLRASPGGPHEIAHWREALQV